MTKKAIVPIALALSAALATPISAHALCVKVPEANLRTGPGTHYDRSWKVYTYMPLKRLERKGDWYRVVDVDGDTHWVHGRLVSDSLRCAVVKSGTANVRSGPGTKYSTTDLGSVEKYYTFKIVGEKGGWAKVQDDVDNSGWIIKSLLWMQ